MPKEDYEILETAKLQTREGDKFVDTDVTAKITRKKGSESRTCTISINGKYYSGFLRPVLTKQDYQDLERIRRERK